MLLAIALGVAIGILAPEIGAAGALIGELFIRLLTLLIVPVIVVSMLGGIMNLESSGNLGRLSLKTITYYTVTTALAVGIGLCMVNLINPGKQELQSTQARFNQAAPEDVKVTAVPERGGLSDVLRNVIPTNIVKAASEGNVLGIIFFSIFLAIALLKIEHAGVTHIREIVAALFAAVIWMVEKAMLLAPIGVLCLVADKVGEFMISGKLAILGSSIGWYAVTVVGGLMVHALVSLPLIAMMFRVNPLRFALAMSPALTTAFSTASSAATLPVTIETLEKRASVSNRTASFVVPLGATVNMDGTAIYEAVAAIFIANMYAIELNASQQLTVFLTATFSAIGAAGIPGAGLIMLALVLNSVGVPAEGIALIVGIDRFLDMLRTCVNVWGDSIGAVVIAKSEGEVVLGST